MAELIEEELTAGFTAHVPGGVPELQELYHRTAVGKLGVVIAEVCPSLGGRQLRWQCRTEHDHSQPHDATPHL